MKTFGDGSEDRSTYTAARPDDAYIEARPADYSFIARFPLEDDVSVSGLAAQELKRFEQARREVYIHELAIASGHRRGGSATALIESARDLAATPGASTEFEKGNADAVAARRLPRLTTVAVQAESARFAALSSTKKRRTLRARLSLPRRTKHW